MNEYCGHALQVAEARKISPHDNLCRAEGISFISLAVEVLGGWGSQACSTIKEIARIRDSRLGVTNSSPLIFKNSKTISDFVEMQRVHLGVSGQVSGQSYLVRLILVVLILVTINSLFLLLL